MDCYLEDSDFKLERSFSQIVPAKQLLIPALEFFNIPAALWPPGARMVKHIIDHPRDYQQALRRQMQACVQVRHAGPPLAGSTMTALHLSRGILAVVRACTGNLQVIRCRCIH